MTFFLPSSSHTHAERPIRFRTVLNGWYYRTDIQSHNAKTMLLRLFARGEVCTYKRVRQIRYARPDTLQQKMENIYKRLLLDEEEVLESLLVFT